jgi:protein TonB
VEDTPPPPRPVLDLPPAAIPPAPPPPPPPPSCPQPNRAAEVTRNFNVERAYPPAALRRNISGSVVVRFTVNSDGTTSGAEIVSADPPGYFESAVTREVGRMRYRPALRNCEPTSDVVELPVQFQLTE